MLALALVGLSSGVVSQDKKTNNAVESDVEFGVKMAQRGLWKEALFRFQQADQQQPNNSRLLNNIAVAYEAVGEYDKALETYKQALQVNASDRELKQNYSRFLEFYQAYNPAQPSEADRKAEGETGGGPSDSEIEDDSAEEARSDEGDVQDSGSESDPDARSQTSSTSSEAPSSSRRHSVPSGSQVGTGRGSR